jgi:hypothetical protein
MKLTLKNPQRRNPAVQKLLDASRGEAPTQDAGSQVLFAPPCRIALRMYTTAPLLGQRNRGTCSRRLQSSLSMRPWGSSRVPRSKIPTGFLKELARAIVRSRSLRLTQCLRPTHQAHQAGRRASMRAQAIGMKTTLDDCGEQYGQCKRDMPSNLNELPKDLPVPIDD